MLQDTVVIEGEVSLVSQIDGDPSLLSEVDGDPDVFIGGGGSQPTGTKSILLTEAGTKTEDVADYASAEINAVKTASASGAVASFSDGAEDVPMTSCVVDIEPVQSGTGDPSPSNVRPISGWSEVNVSVTGINVWDEEWEVGRIKGSGQTDQASNAIRSKNFCPCVGDTAYYCSCGKTDGGNQNRYYVAIFWYDENKNFISYNWCNMFTVTSPSNAKYFKIGTNTSTVVYGNTYNNDICVNYPSTDHDYHAYNGTQYTTALGQTVYGGTLDVVTGVLTVDRAIVDMTSITSWVIDKSAQRIYKILSYIKPNTSGATVPNMLCNRFKTISPDNIYSKTIQGVTVSTGSALQFHIDGLTDRADVTLTEINQYFTDNPTQVVYELATHTTVQLTPTEVKTLLGSNNVWADSGDISVGYKADVYLSEGGIIPTGTKQITIASNGTVTEDVTSYANAEINVNVPASAVDTGTKNINTNGTHDVVGYASASVNVPNSYSQSDEGKVVSNGALVAQSSDTVTQNGTVDTTLINSLTVNVGSVPPTPVPSEYQEVEYIVCSEKCYFNLGQRTYTNPGAEADFLLLGRYNAYGPHLISSGNDNYFLFVPRGTRGTNIAICGTTSDRATEAPLNKRIHAELNVDGDGLFTMVWEGGSAGSSVAKGSLTTGTIYLCCYKDSPGSRDYQLNGNLYRIKLYEDGEIVEDFVPCYRKQDTVIGLYDVENDIFYTNSGSGTLGKGGDVISDAQALSIMLGGE